MEYVALICARGGSKGVPGKNIKLFNGIPLIGWSISVAKKIKRISRVIVSTDSEEIAKIAREYGAEVPFIRPKKLALEDSSEWLSWRHAINFMDEYFNKDPYCIVVLPPTAPLRTVNDVNICIDEFEKGEVDSVITVSDAQRSPYFNMVKTDSKGYSSLVMKPEEKIIRRQDAPKLFDMTTVAYIVDSTFIKKYNGLFEGRIRSVNIPRERAVDIDTIIDFKFAEIIMKNNLSLKNS
jgi:CMP-N-acetylneuraminic acid synthetase